ncbi:MAG: MotA/TolQ/ExbB proton channel family protein [Candidatus Omnitrophica bacterium]|nr:MotA/TolQ/ExbB proton channel family protein [Candidatus Omnitrophota bacterium]
MFWDQSLIQLFLKGGFAMWPLLLCSIVAVAIIVERAYYFWRLRFNYEAFGRELKGLLAKRKVKEAVALARKHSNPIPRIAEHYLRHLESDSMRNEILKREGSFALEKVEARLRALAALTHLAPLLGLLGTVTGLVTAFHQIELLGGQVQPGDLAAGIWEALITTVFGLMIAIPTMAAYHGFESEADRIARRMQFIVSELDEFFGKHSSGDFKSADTEAIQESMKAVN